MFLNTTHLCSGTRIIDQKRRSSADPTGQKTLKWLQYARRRKVVLYRSVTVRATPTRIL